MSTTPSSAPVAVVTGGNRGIGHEVCRQLADRDLDVVLCARSRDAAQGAAERLWAQGLDTVHPRVVDVTDGAQVDRLVAGVDREFGRLDVLVNCAGVLLDRDRAVLDPDVELVRRSLEVNAVGPLRLVAACVPIMRRGGRGRIVNVSTGMATLAGMDGGAPGYRLSKVALNGFTRAAAAELAGDPILVNAVDPGWVRTDMGGPAATREVAEGADTVVWLATLPDDGPRGGFFRDRRPYVP